MAAAVRYVPTSIEVGTYLTAAAMTGGLVKIKSAKPQYLSSVILKLESCGAIITQGEDWVEIKMDNQKRCLSF